MPQKMAEFGWWVAPEGYRWRSGVRMPERPIPPGAQPGCSLSSDPTLALHQVRYDTNVVHGRWFVPDSALFRTFADLDGTAESALAFANRYGQLDLWNPTINPEDPWYAYEEAVSAPGGWVHPPKMPETPRWESTDETLAGWHMEIGMMRTCIDLHDALESPNPEHTLRWHFSRLHESIAEGTFTVFEYKTLKHGQHRSSARWSARVALTDSREYRSDPDDPNANFGYEISLHHFEEWIASYYLPWFYEDSGGSDILEYARVLLAQVANAHLTGRIDTMLLPEPETGRPVLFTMPKSLIGALWLQLAQSIDGHKQFRQCESCRTWFELAPDKARSDKSYCSTMCRSRAYRRRRRETSESILR